MFALVALFSNLAALYKSARAGVDDAVDVGVMMPEVMIHIDDGYFAGTMVRRSRCQWCEDNDLWFFILSTLRHLSYIHQSQELTVYLGQTVSETLASHCNGLTR